jgi:hypothetical protein
VRWALEEAGLLYRVTLAGVGALADPIPLSLIQLFDRYGDRKMMA